MAKGVRFVPKDGIWDDLCSLDGVNEITSSVAEAIKDQATAMLDKDEGYRLDDFEIVELESSGKVVRTQTDHARYSQNKNKTLTKAFKAQREA